MFRVSLQIPMARRQHRLGEGLGLYTLFVGPPGQLTGHFVMQDAGLDGPPIDPTGFSYVV